MNTVNVKFLKYHSFGCKGDVVNVSEDVAKRLVESRYAVVIPGEPKPSKKSGKKSGDRPEIKNKAMSA